jgi:hypothetical protein
MMYKEQLEKAISLYLKIHLSDLKTLKWDKNIIFYKVNSGNVLIEYDTENNKLWTSHSKIWNHLQELFQISYFDVEPHLKNWFLNTYSYSVQKETLCVNPRM